MPWLTILSWVISFLMSYAKTKDAGKSALIATGVAAAAYYTLEPTNEDAIFGDTTRDWFGYEPVDPSTALTGQTGMTDPSMPSTLSTLGTEAIRTTGQVATAWGPVGTMGVIAGTAALTGNMSTTMKLALVGGAAILLLK